jgi:hypothetical protein
MNFIILSIIVLSFFFITNKLYNKESYINNIKNNTNFGHYDFIRSDLGQNGNSLNYKITNII